MRRSAKLVLFTVSALLLPATGAQATQTASPGSLAFGPTPAGKESPPQTVTYSVDTLETYRTTFRSPLTSSCSLTTFRCSFRHTTTCPVEPATFPPGPQTCTYSIYFTPTGPGPASAKLQITPTTAVALSGVGSASKKGKKCKKKGKKSASAAKKKCGKKK
jgi:hypothetical protein